MRNTLIIGGVAVVLLILIFAMWGAEEASDTPVENAAEAVEDAADDAADAVEDAAEGAADAVEEAAE